MEASARSRCGSEEDIPEALGLIFFAGGIGLVFRFGGIMKPRGQASKCVTRARRLQYVDDLLGSEYCPPEI